MSTVARELLKLFLEDWKAMRNKGLSIEEESKEYTKLLDKYEKLLSS